MPGTRDDLPSLVPCARQLEKDNAMNSVRLSCLVGAVAVFGLGMGAEACSSSSPTGNSSTSTSTSSGASSTKTSTTTSGGSTVSSTSGASTGTTSGTTTSGASTSGSSAKCFAAPGDKVFAEDGGAFYCPFSGVDGGKAVSCTPGTEHCCETAAAGAACTPTATACGATDTDWHCEGTPDCVGSAGTICCGSGTLALQAAQPGCGDGGTTLGSYEYVSGFKGSTCVAAAACTGFQICSKNSECSSGVCSPIKPKGNSIGYCVGSGTGTGSSSTSSSSSGSSGSGSSS